MIPGVNAIGWAIGVVLLSAFTGLLSLRVLDFVLAPFLMVKHLKPSGRWYSSALGRWLR